MESGLCGLPTHLAIAMVDDSFLSAVLSEHGEYRAAPCFFCRSSWEERLVGVTLRRYDETLGNLCPRCLSYTPRQNAIWLREYGDALRQALADLNSSLSEKTPLPHSIDEYRAATLEVVQIQTIDAAI